jgi:hypothetical protein
VPDEKVCLSVHRTSIPRPGAQGSPVRRPSIGRTSGCGAVGIGEEGRRKTPSASDRPRT